jgi:putative transposase
VRLADASSSRHSCTVAAKHRDFAPGIHHVWIGATGGEAYFRDERDRSAWISGLVHATASHGWTCIAFCRMTTHAHVLLDVPDQSLPVGMQRMNSDYSRRYNIRHDRVGQFVRKRYGNRRIDHAADLLGAFGYVSLNPVRAGLCPRAEDWRWSSLASTLGMTNDFPFVDARFVLAEFAGSTERLRAFVEARWNAYLSERAMSSRLTTGRVAPGHD